MIRVLVLLASACVKPAVEVEAPVERDAAVAPGSPETVLFAALSADDFGVRALAAEALLRHPPAAQSGGLGLASALDRSLDDRVRLAVIAALKSRRAEPEVGAHLWTIVRGDTDANLRVRGFAALALVGADAGLDRELAALGATTPRVGAALGLLAAARAAGSPEASVALHALLSTAMLPLEPAFFVALNDSSLPWRAALAGAEPAARGPVACGMMVSGAPGGAAVAASLLHAADEDVRFDMAAVLRDCPARQSAGLLRASSRPEARLARVARGELPPDVGAALLATELWPDAVRALAARPEETAHVPLRTFAAEQGDLQREVVAVALASTALPGDLSLLQSLETDASFRTRVAAAAARLRLAAAPR